MVMMVLMLFFQLLCLATSMVMDPYEPYSLFHLCNYEKNFTTTQGLDQLLQNLKPNTSSLHYSTASNDSLPLYALLQCRRDLLGGDCVRCSTAAGTDLKQKCPHQVDAMIWYNGCFLRYDNQSFFSKLDTDYYYDWWNAKNYWWNAKNNADSTFVEKNNELMHTLACEAKNSGKGYALGSINFTSSTTVFGMVQCNEDLRVDDCSKCLQVAVNRSRGPCQQYNGIDCPSKIGRLILMKNCYVQYDLRIFYNDSSEGLINVPSSNCNFVGSQGIDNVNQGKDGSKKIIYYALGGAGGGVLFLSLFFFFLANKRKESSTFCLTSLLPPIIKKDFDVPLEQILPTEMGTFSSDAMVAATNNFSIENELGKGGFGIVYLGKLVNGQEVAVKKLLFQSDQGRKEFLNEVGLLVKVQHMNLITLVGCCVEGQERLLVYEYMPNRSLDTMLFDPSKKSRLNWDTRFELIIGIARGLQYLHQESRIIHRDIKAANILLDEHLCPKIADFGMARLFSIDQSRLASKIAGTLGYIAPEYAKYGTLSTKADIYSFGVLVLEIISGRRNNEPAPPLVESKLGLVVWASKLQKEGRCLELVDPEGENWPKGLVLRCFNVALLCTKSKSSKRPSISVALTMLSSDSNPSSSINNYSSSYSSNNKKIDPFPTSINELTITEVSGR